MGGVLKRGQEGVVMRRKDILLLARQMCVAVLSVTLVLEAVDARMSLAETQSAGPEMSVVQGGEALEAHGEHQPEQKADKPVTDKPKEDHCATAAPTTSANDSASGGRDSVTLDGGVVTHAPREDEVTGRTLEDAASQANGEEQSAPNPDARENTSVLEAEPSHEFSQPPTQQEDQPDESVELPADGPDASCEKREPTECLPIVGQLQALDDSTSMASASEAVGCRAAGQEGGSRQALAHDGFEDNATSQNVQAEYGGVREHQDSECELTICANYGERQKRVEARVSAGASCEAPRCPFQREGYDFVGWNAEEHGYGVSYAAGDQIDLYDDLTLYAQWKPRVYYVTFASNGGSGIATQRVEHGKHAQEPANPTKGGYTFVGWYSDDSLFRAYDFGMPVTGNLTLYARWKRTSVAKADISLDSSSYVYDGQAKYPKVRVVVHGRVLKNDVDYKTVYRNNVDAGMAKVTITGRGVYTGVASTSFRIRPTTFAVTPPKTQTYTGHAILAMPTVTSGSRTLMLGLDYTLAWSKNTEPGIASVTVKGKGNYVGTKQVTFSIVKEGGSSGNDGK